MFFGQAANPTLAALWNLSKITVAESRYAIENGVNGTIVCAGMANSVASWTQAISWPAQTFNGASYYASSQRSLCATPAGANQFTELSALTAPTHATIVRLPTTAAGLTGFSFMLNFGMDVWRSDAVAFAGLTSNLGVLTGLTSYSSQLNALAVVKDIGDANWFFLTNNGAGAGNRTDTGIPVTAQQYYRLIVTGDQSGNINMSLSNFDTQKSTTLSVPNGTTKLPVATTPLIQHLTFCNGNVTTTSVTGTFFNYVIASAGI